jgi:hypothetical protein
VCLAAHDSEFRRWPYGVDRRICQTFAASPAEPGELPLGFSPEVAVRPEGANLQWRRNPPGELSIDPVADARLRRFCKALRNKCRLDGLPAEMCPCPRQLAGFSF